MPAGTKLTRLRPMDAFLLRLESKTTHLHTASLLVFERPTDASEGYLDELFELLQSVPHAEAPPFAYRLYRGRRWFRPRWETVDEVDLPSHFHRGHLSGSGDVLDLTQHVQSIHSEPLDLSRPLWDFHLIDGLADGRFALYLKMHHALADGGTVVRMLTSFLSDVPEPFSVERALLKRRRLRETAAPAAPAGKEERKGRAVVMALRALWMQLRGAAHSRGDERVMPYRTPPTPFRRATGPDRGYAVLSLPLARLRALRDRSGATINDIVLEISAAALRQYLAERDALPAQPLVASVPVALERGAGDVDAGNELSAINVALPTHLDDPAERLGFIRRSMYEGKRFLFSMPKAAIDAYTSLVLMPFAVSQMLGFGERIRPYWNVVVSNVPGPRETLYLHGSRLEYMYPCSVVFHGHALNITARGCGDQLNFGLVVCRDAVPDVQRIADHIAAAFERLDAAYAAGDPWP